MEILNPIRNTFSVRVKVEHFPMNLKISNLLFLAAKHKSKGSQEVLNMRSRIGQFFSKQKGSLFPNGHLFGGLKKQFRELAEILSEKSCKQKSL